MSVLSIECTRKYGLVKRQPVSMLFALQLFQQGTGPLSSVCGRVIFHSRLRLVVGSETIERIVVL